MGRRRRRRRRHEDLPHNQGRAFGHRRARAPTTAPATTIAGFATPDEAVAARYGPSYLGSCESVPVDGHWADDAMCSIRVDLSDSQVVVFAGPPYSEVLEDLLVRHEGGAWHVVDSYTPGEPGVEDPHTPDWVHAAGEIKDGGHE